MVALTARWLHCLADSVARCAAQRTAVEQLGALEDMEQRLGQYSPDTNNWRLGNLVKVRWEHSPFSETPLRGFFEEWRDHNGNRRTPTMQMHFYQSAGKKYMVQAGAVFKMVVDMNEPTSAWFTMDVETDQSRLYGR